MADCIGDSYARSRKELGDFGFSLPEFAGHVQRAFQQSKFSDVGRLQLGDLYLTLGMVVRNERAWQYFDRYCKPTLIKSAMKIVGNLSDAELVASVCTESFLTKGIRYSGSGLFTSWLYAFARGRAIDALRSGQCRTEGTDREIGESGVGGSPSPYEECEDIVAKLFAQSKAAMPAMDFEIVDYHFFQGMKQKEIAKVIGRNPSNVTRAIKRACATMESVAIRLCRELEIVLADVADCMRLMGI